jgi:hypothetical protein
MINETGKSRRFLLKRRASPYLLLMAVHHYAYLLMLLVPPSIEGLLPMADEVIACRSKIRLSDRFGDVDIPSHVVRIERGFVKRGRWLHLPVPLPL